MRVTSRSKFFQENILLDQNFKIGNKKMGYEFKYFEFQTFQIRSKYNIMLRVFFSVHLHNIPSIPNRAKKSFLKALYLMLC